MGKIQTAGVWITPGSLGWKNNQRKILLNVRLCLDLLYTTSRYSAVSSQCPQSPKRPLPLRGDKAEHLPQDTQWCCSLQMPTLHIQENFWWPGLKEQWKRTPWQSKSLHLMIFRQSTANKKCYSSEPKGHSVQTRPAQQANAPKDCSTVLLHLTEKIGSV